MLNETSPPYPQPNCFTQHPFGFQAGTQSVLGIPEGNKTLEVTWETYVCSLGPFLGCRKNNTSEMGQHMTTTLPPGFHSKLKACVWGLPLPHRELGTPWS